MHDFWNGIQSVGSSLLHAFSFPLLFFSFVLRSSFCPSLPSSLYASIPISGINPNAPSSHFLAWRWSHVFFCFLPASLQRAETPQQEATDLSRGVARCIQHPHFYNHNLTFERKQRHSKRNIRLIQGEKPAVIIRKGRRLDVT